MKNSEKKICTSKNHQKKTLRKKNEKKGYRIKKKG